MAVPDQAVDLVSQSLMALGCTGVTAAERSLDTFVAPAPEELHNDPVIRAYFPFPEDPEELCREITAELAMLSGLYPGIELARLRFRELKAHDWASDWKQYFPPFRVGRRLVIHPSWVDYRPVAEERTLTLDPGQAFGTGTHATTGLCLEALAGFLEGAATPPRVLDVGTGSGILAMAAAVLGAESVLACDIDPLACRVARENVAGNGLAAQVRISEAPLEELPGSFDLVLANILAAENIRLGAQLVARLRPGGLLVLSGILIEQERQVLEAFADHPLTLDAVSHRDEWTCICYRRHE